MNRWASETNSCLLCMAAAQIRFLVSTAARPSLARRGHNSLHNKPRRPTHTPVQFIVFPFMLWHYGNQQPWSQPTVHVIIRSIKLPQRPLFAHSVLWPILQYTIKSTDQAVKGRHGVWWPAPAQQHPALSVSWVDRSVGHLLGWRTNERATDRPTPLPSHYHPRPACFMYARGRLSLQLHCWQSADCGLKQLVQIRALCLCMLVLY